MTDRTGHTHHALESRVSMLVRSDQKIWHVLMQLLADKYSAEFTVVEGVSAHPRGLTFSEWLQQKGVGP